MNSAHYLVRRSSRRALRSLRRAPSGAGGACRVCQNVRVRLNHDHTIAISIIHFSIVSILTRTCTYAEMIREPMQQHVSRSGHNLARLDVLNEESGMRETGSSRAR